MNLNGQILFDKYRYRNDPLKHDLIKINNYNKIYYFPNLEDIGCSIIVEITDLLQNIFYILQTDILKFDDKLIKDYDEFYKKGYITFPVKIISYYRHSSLTPIINIDNYNSKLIISTDFIQFDTSDMFLKNSILPPFIIVPLTPKFYISTSISSTRCILLSTTTYTIKFYPISQYQRNLIIYIIKRIYNEYNLIIISDLFNKYDIKKEEYIKYYQNIETSSFYTLLKLIEDEYYSVINYLRNKMIKKNFKIIELKKKINDIELKCLTSNSKLNNKTEEYIKIIHSLTSELIRKDKIIDKLFKKSKNII